MVRAIKICLPLECWGQRYALSRLAQDRSGAQYVDKTGLTQGSTSLASARIKGVCHCAWFYLRNSSGSGSEDFRTILGLFLLSCFLLVFVFLRQAAISLG